MKRLLAVLLIIAMSFIAKITMAQSVGIFYKNGQPAIGDTVTFTHSIDTVSPLPFFEHKPFVNIVNIDTVVRTFKVERIEHQIINGTKDYFCWGKQCFNEVAAGTRPSWIPNDSTTLMPGDTAGNKTGEFGLKIYFKANGNTGEALYEYRIFNVADPLGADNGSIYVKYLLDYATAIDESLAQKYNFSIYPNPTNTIAKIDLNLPKGNSSYTLVIKDILGKEVDRKNIGFGQKQVEINMSKHSKGLYFVSLMNQNNILKTKKLIVN